jgi:hypothetical protein
MAADRPPSSLPWSTALVTGASSGIGAALARELAAGGVGRLVLVARRAERLEALAADLADRHGTEVQVLVADLAERAGLAAVESRLASGTPAVDLLVNNAGVGTAGRFVDAPVDALEAQLQLNVLALMRLSRAALPGMVGRGHGALCNVSSLASYQPAPGSAVYAAGKAFVTSLSESLHEEVRGTGVTVTAVCPGFTRTEFLDTSGGSEAAGMPDLVWMTAEAVAREAVVATARGRALCVPGLGYKALVAIETPLPRSARRWLIGRASASGGASARRR